MTALGMSTTRVDSEMDDRRSGSDRRDDDPGLQIRWSMVVQVIGYLLGMFVVYNAMTSRLTALETYRQTDSQRMERIENKLDAALSLGRKP